MLPTERRQVGEQMVGRILGLSKGRDGALEVSRVPQDNGGDEQVETGRTVLLVCGGPDRSSPTVAMWLAKGTGAATPLARLSQLDDQKRPSI